jgi:hypothetical protein
MIRSLEGQNWELRPDPHGRYSEQVIIIGILQDIRAEMYSLNRHLNNQSNKLQKMQTSVAAMKKTFNEIKETYVKEASPE